MIQDTKKQTIINKLTLLDTSSYRIRKHHLVNITEIPKHYRNNKLTNNNWLITNITEIATIAVGSQTLPLISS